MEVEGEPLQTYQVCKQALFPGDVLGKSELIRDFPTLEEAVQFAKQQHGKRVAVYVHNQEVWPAKTPKA